MHLKVLRSLAKRKKHERRTGSQALLKPLEGQETHGRHPQARNTPTVASPASAAGQHKRTGKTSVKPDVCCESPPVSALAHRPTVMCLNARHVGLKGPRVQTLGLQIPPGRRDHDIWKLPDVPRDHPLHRTPHPANGA